MIQTELSNETISTRAYELWEKAGSPHGQDRENWLQAEAELSASSRNQQGLDNVLAATLSGPGRTSPPITSTGVNRGFNSPKPSRA